MVYAILNTVRRQIEDLGVHVGFYTQSRFKPAFKHVDWLHWGVDDKIALLRTEQAKYDICFSLNGVLERDHTLKEHDQENRLKMLAESLGMEDVVEA